MTFQCPFGFEFLAAHVTEVGLLGAVAIHMSLEVALATSCIVTQRTFEGLHTYQREMYRCVFTEVCAHICGAPGGHIKHPSEQSSVLAFSQQGPHSPCVTHLTLLHTIEILQCQSRSLSLCCSLGFLVAHQHPIILSSLLLECFALHTGLIRSALPAVW